jgi:peptidoglycan/xylan/chitin deacetylase (PgdA/CDA1 family)
MTIPATRRLREQLIASGFNILNATGVHRALRPFTQGMGAILMFHHVRPWAGGTFAPNRLLEIVPDFFETTIRTTREAGFDIISLDAAVTRISSPDRRSERPFAVFTFDDGYRDNRDHALPIMKKHEVPFTLFVTSGFADHAARLWWLELEEAVRKLSHVRLSQSSGSFDLPARTAEEKQTAFQTLYWSLRPGPEEQLLEAAATLCAEAGIRSGDLVARHCMDWDELRAIASEPLCSIGVHTLSHPMLAKHDEAFVRRELAESRTIIEERLGVSAAHLAYPVGDRGSAGPREYAIAAELGFAAAVTTRPGMVFADHAAHLMALPRLSVNGNWQDRRHLELLLSGVPFALWNRGRKLNVA